jgi:hypothetical protein
MRDRSWGGKGYHPGRAHGAINSFSTPETFALMILVGVEHGQVLGGRGLSPGNVEVGTRQMKVKRNVLEPL